MLETILADARAGQSALSAAIRQLVAQSSMGEAETLDRVPDAALEPLLFQHFAFGDEPAELAALLAGYGARCGRSCRARIHISRGETLFVPGLGYLARTAGDGVADFIVNADSGSAWLQCGALVARSPIVAPLMLGETGIDVARLPYRQLRRAFEIEGLAGAAETVADAARRASDLDLGLDTLDAAWPELGVALRRCVRRIVLFRRPGSNSFASTREHGTIYLNVELAGNDIGFIEDIAHQGGHVLFFAASQHPEEYFTVPAGDPLEAHGVAGDCRSLYVALHGIVTEALMMACLDRCLSAGTIEGVRLLELQGRLAFVATRFRLDAGVFARLQVLTSKGQALIRSLIQLLEDFTARRARLVLTSDLGNQPYNFDLEAFLDANHLAVRSRAEAGS